MVATIISSNFGPTATIVLILCLAGKPYRKPSDIFLRITKKCAITWHVTGAFKPFWLMNIKIKNLKINGIGEAYNGVSVFSKNSQIRQNVPVIWIIVATEQCFLIKTVFKNCIYFWRWDRRPEMLSMRRSVWPDMRWLQHWQNRISKGLQWHSPKLHNVLLQWR